MATKTKAKAKKAPAETARERLERLAGELRQHWRVGSRLLSPGEYVARTWRLWAEAADALAELGGVATLADGREVALADHPWSICWNPIPEGKTPAQLAAWATYWAGAKDRGRRLAEGRA